MKKIILVLFVVASLNASAQSKVQDSLVDRINYLTKKIVNTRFVIYNIQDYMNLCKANPKLNKFDPGWIQRILDDYYKTSGDTPPKRQKVVHLKVAVKKPIKKGH